MVFTHGKAHGHKRYGMGFIEIRAYVWLCHAWFLVLVNSMTSGFTYNNNTSYPNLRKRRVTSCYRTKLNEIYFSKKEKLL
jgi:hypothetical protein